MIQITRTFENEKEFQASMSNNKNKKGLGFFEFVGALYCATVAIDVAWDFGRWCSQKLSERKAQKAKKA